MNIALIGPSGVGKGTHAEKLIERFDMVHIATGDLFRDNLEQQTALGLLARNYMNQGEMVPDEVVAAMIESSLLKIPPDKGILFDGFPRTRYQAQTLDDLFIRMHRELDAVIYLKVPDDEVIRRLSGRLICSECSGIFHKIYKPFKKCPYNKCAGEHLHHNPELTPERIQARLRLFHRATGAVVFYYQQQGKLIIIDGESDIEQVYQEIVDAIEGVQQLRGQMATAEETQQILRLVRKPTALRPDQAVHRSLDIVLVGAPGSGKGTQAEQLRTEFDLPHIATGDLFRHNLKNETDLGKLAKTYMDRGELVPDEVTEAMVRDRLSQPDARDGFILDGFPRTRAQAEALTEMLNGMNRRLSGVLYIKVSDQEIIRRLSGRVICRECQTPFHTEFNPFKQCPYNKCEGEYLYQRDDDNPETIRARLRTYHGQTTPVIDYYRDAGLVIEIPGEGDLADVRQRTMTAALRLQSQALSVG